MSGNPVTVDFDGLSITIRGDTISGGEGVPGGVSVNSADVGGNWTRTGAGVYKMGNVLWEYGGVLSMASWGS